MSRGSWCYVAIQPCGCITGLAVDLTVEADTEQNRKFVAGMIADFIKGGCKIERRWVGEGGAELRTGWPESCPHKPQQLDLGSVG